MEFEYVVDFFSSLNYVKRKYPMIVTYVNKYLNTLEDENAKFKELTHLRRFLIVNPEIKNKIFTHPDFKTGKQSLTLAMDNFLIGTEEQINFFWNKLIQLENILFPDGKPDPHFNKQEESPSGASGISKAMALLETSPVFSGIIEQVKTSVEASVSNMRDNIDINSIMEMPDFENIVENMVKSIKFNINSGKYKLKDLKTTVSDVVNSLQEDNLDEETRETLKAITDTINNIERGETPSLFEMFQTIGKFNP